MSANDKPQPDFKPGLYRHYKGNLYTASMLVQHHERRTWYVVYVSLVHGSWNIRPLVSSAHPDESACAWTDDVVDAAGNLVPRFRPVSGSTIREAIDPAPSEVVECASIGEMSDIDPSLFTKERGILIVFVQSVERHYRWLPHSQAIPDGVYCVQLRKHHHMGRFIQLP